MSFDLHLKAVCGGCGSASDLYGSNCKHMTLCMSCGKKMAQIRQKCFECGVPVTRLIREYNVRTTSANDKSYFIGRFVAGLPTFSKKKNSDKTWTIQKEGLQGRSNVTDSLRDKFKNRPWLLEDESGQFHYHGMLEGAQSATYYLLVMQGKEFVAIPAGSWYNFSKVAQYKQLTLEEAEEKMKNRRKTADGYERWMMKASIADKEGGVGTGSGSGRGRKKASADDEDGNDSDRGDEDEQDDDTRKSRVVRNKKTDDDDGEGRRGGDHDFDDDDVEKGDDWEHEEIFTDDDEAVGNDPEEREDLAPEVPAPPEIKQDEEDEDDEANEEEGTGLSKSGKEIKKLLGRMNDSDAEDDDDDDDDDDETGSSPVLAPKKKDPAVKEEPTDTTPSKPAVASSKGGTPSTSKSTKGKRKPGGDDVKVSNGTPPPKKVKTENETNKPGSTNNGSATPKEAQAAASGPVTEEEIRAVLMQKSPVTTQDLVAKFKSRLKSPKDKQAFADILKKISKIQKTNGASFVVLRDK